MRQRNIGIDILKCIAAIMITNSHMELLYGKYSFLATGGAIGDVLFFFCSGFTLFLERMGRFDNWYKRRISRIYPTVFAWAILSAFVFDNKKSMDQIIINGGGWFVTCIMIYYIALYFIQRFCFSKLKFVFGTVSVLCIIWYLSIERPEGYNMYGNTYFKWCHYFLFMLLGAMVGGYNKDYKYNLKKDFLFLFYSIITYYGIIFAGRKNPVLEDLQIISLIPLLFVTFYFYKVCNNELLKQIYNKRLIGWCIKFIGGLCLEIYLVQSSLFTDKMNSIFPLNLFIMFVIIVLAAYILRCASRIFSQIFKEGDMNWKAILRCI